MKAWEEFLRQQETELGSAAFERWLKPLRLIRFDAGNVHLEAGDSFQVMWFEEHLRKKAEASLLATSQRRIKVHVAVQGPETTTQAKGPSLPSAKPAPKVQGAPPAQDYLSRRDEIDPHATFDNFVCSEDNLLPYKLLSGLANQREDMSSFNPIYLYGPSGVGKSHLLMATAQSLRETGLKVLYARASTFTEQVVAAIRSGGMRQLRQLHRESDVLILDNVELFSGKAATQEEFFHTFNALHIATRLIILSSSVPPSELKAIEPRLVSRFEWGIALPLEPLAPTELEQVLRGKAALLDFPLSDGVVSFLLERFQNSAKGLLKSLEALVLRTHLERAEGRAPTLPLSAGQAEIFLADLLRQEDRDRLTPDKLIHAVAEHYGIRVEDILSKAQSRDIALPRQVAMHFLRDELKLPYMKIGGIFNRDHSTVMASVKQIKKQLENQNTELTGALTTISRKVHAPSSS